MKTENTALLAKRTPKKTRPQDRYKVYGKPVPSGVDTSASTLAKVREVLEGGNKFFITHYVRKEPFSFVHRVNGKAVGAGFSKGEPRGILVAFKYEDQILVGWSKWNEGAAENGKPLEMRRFTKADALQVAMIRAFEDVIQINDAQGFFMEKAENPIPKAIVRELRPFIERAVRYFKKAPANVKLG